MLNIKLKTEITNYNPNFDSMGAEHRHKSVANCLNFLNFCKNVFFPLVLEQTFRLYNYSHLKLTYSQTLKNGLWTTSFRSSADQFTSWSGNFYFGSC